LRPLDTAAGIGKNPVMTRCILLVALTAALSAQQPIKRSVNLTVSDPRNRLVTGLDSDDFIVVEAGVRRPITAFKPAGSPIAIAVVSKRRVDAEVIQASTTADALAQLAAASAPRKALIIAEIGRVCSSDLVHLSQSRWFPRGALMPRLFRRRRLRTRWRNSLRRPHRAKP